MRYFVLFLLTSLIAWAPEWLPHYVAAFSGDQLEVMGSLRSYEVPCELPAHGKMKCRNAYRIPQTELRGESVGLGTLISATEIRCKNSGSSVIYFGDSESPARALEMQKTYQTVELKSLNCDGDLLVQVWSPEFYTRSGVIGSPWVRGKSGAVAQVKRVVQFVSAEFYLILSLLLVLCFWVQTIILKPVLIAETRVDSWRAYAGFWVLFSVLKSGLVELVFPIVSPFLIFVRLNNWASLMAHSLPVLAALSVEVFLPRRFAPVLPKVWGILLVALVLSGGFGFLLSGVGVFTATLALFVGVTRKRVDLFFFAPALIVECLKLFNISGLPTGSTTVLFVSGVLLTEFYWDLRQAAAVAGVLRWWKRVSVQSSFSVPDALVRAFAEQFGVSKVSLLIPHLQGECLIVQQQKNSKAEWMSQSLVLEAIPPVFSHVLTTGEALWNVDERSTQAYNLKKGGIASENESESHRQRLFSVLPVKRGAQVLGAIALTRYDEGLASPRTARELTEFAYRILEPNLAQLLHVQTMQTADDWHRKCSLLASEWGRLSEGSNERMDLREWMQKASDQLAHHLGVKVLFSRVHPETQQLDVKVVSGFEPEVGAHYLQTQFYALRGNLQGPMPMAVSQKRVVTVSNLDWLKAVLHPRSLELFKKSNAHSGAAVPIGGGEGGSDVWGVLWLESTENGFFTSDAVVGLSLLAESLGTQLSKLLLSQRAHEALSGISRPDVASRLLKGEKVFEAETGILAMLDIRGSTVLANRYGAEAWKNLMIEVEPEVTSIAKGYGYQLQRVVWDAFFFTRGCQHPDDKAVGQTLEMALRLDQLLSQRLMLTFPEEMARRNTRAIRVCLEYGDISRGFLNGVWTISGVAMACVHKLEAACKGLPGWFFLTGGFDVGDRSVFRQTDVKHPSTGEEIWHASGYEDVQSSA